MGKRYKPHLWEPGEIDFFYGFLADVIELYFEDVKINPKSPPNKVEIRWMGATLGYAHVEDWNDFYFIQFEEETPANGKLAYVDEENDTLKSIWIPNYIEQIDDIVRRRIAATPQGWQVTQPKELPARSEPEKTGPGRPVRLSEERKKRAYNEIYVLETKTIKEVEAELKRENIKVDRRTLQRYFAELRKDNQEGV